MTGGFGRSLHRYRVARGWTQRELAAKAGVSVRALRDLEQGLIDRPRATTVHRLASALGIETTDLDEAPPDDGERPAAGQIGGGAPAVRDAGSGPWRVDILGPLSIRHGDTPVELAGPRQRLLLALLALRAGEVVTAAEVIDVLWGDRPPRTARDLVNVHLNRVRAGLVAVGPPDAPPPLVRVASGYQMIVHSDQVDAVRFRVAARRGLAAGDATDRRDQLRRALRCWRGPVLADEDDRLRQHPVAVDLQRLRVTAALAYADLCLGTESGPDADPAAAAALLHEVAAAEPWHEAVHARLMLALAASGATAQALAVGADLRRRLADELGLEPGPEIREAHLRVLRHEARPPGRSPASAGRSSPVGGATAPPLDVAGFVGRAQESAALDATSGRVVLLTGVAGVGKTALAVHWGRSRSGDFPGGLHYVNLHGFDRRRPTTVDAAVDQLLWGMGWPPAEVPADLDRKLALYRVAARDARALIVLDNARDAAQVRPLLAVGPGSAVIVTSRHQLDSLVVHDGATVIPVAPMPVDEADELLATVSGRHRTAQFREVARWCGYLPLALRIIACRLAARPELSVAALVDDLRQRGSRLAAMEIDATDAGVRAAFTPSYRALPPAAATMFRLLGLHDGPSLPLAAAARLAGWTEPATAQALATLVGANLAVRMSTQDYTVHDLIRLYAAELGAEDPEADRRRAVRRLLDWYSDTAYRAFATISSRVVPAERDIAEPPPEPVTFAGVGPANAWFARERDNIAALVATAIAWGFTRTAWELAQSTFGYNMHQGRWADWIDVSHQALAAATAAGDARGELILLSGLSIAHRHLGDDAAAGHYGELNLRSTQAAGEPLPIGQAHINLAAHYTYVDDAARAETHLRAAADIAEVTDHPTMGPSLRLTFGFFLYHQYRFDEAAQWLYGGLDSAGETAEPMTITLLHHGVGEVALQQRRDADAATHARAAVAMAERAGFTLRLAYALNLLGTSLARVDPAEARACWSRAAELADGLGHPLSEASRHWLDTEPPATAEEWYAAELPRRLWINRLP